MKKLIDGYWSVSLRTSDTLPQEKDYYRMAVVVENQRIFQISFEHPALINDPFQRTILYQSWTADFLYQRGWTKADIKSNNLSFKLIKSEQNMMDFVNSKGFKLSGFIKEHLPFIIFDDVNHIKKIETENIEAKTDFGIRLIIGKLTT